MKFHHIWFYIIIIWIIGCKNKKIIYTNDSEVEIIQCLNCSSGFIENYPKYSNLKFIPLETTNPYFIKSIQQIEIKDTMIYILDIHNYLYIFNQNGKFINQINNINNETKCYVKISCFYIDNINNNIVIIDENEKTLNRFDLKGKYISYEDIPLEHIKGSRKAIITEDCKLLLHNAINSRENMAYSIIDIDKKKLLGNYFNYSPINSINHNYVFSRHPMAMTEEGISFIRPLNDTIYQYSSSQFSPKYVVETPGRIPLLNEIVTTENSYNNIIKSLGDKGYFTGFSGIFETSNYLILSFTRPSGLSGYFFADKRKKEGNYYISAISENSNEIPFFPLMSSHQNSFISAIEPRQLLALDYKIDENDETGKKFQIMLENLDEQDNPVLFFYEFD